VNLATKYIHSSHYRSPVKIAVKLKSLKNRKALIDIFNRLKGVKRGSGLMIPTPVKHKKSYKIPVSG